MGVWGEWEFWLEGIQPLCASLYPNRGAAPQPPDPRPDREPVHPAGWIQVGQERQDGENNPPKNWEKPRGDPVVAF